MRTLIHNTLHAAPVPSNGRRVRWLKSWCSHAEEEGKTIPAIAAGRRSKAI